MRLALAGGVGSVAVVAGTVAGLTAAIRAFAAAEHLHLEWCAYVYAFLSALVAKMLCYKWGT